MLSGLRPIHYFRSGMDVCRPEEDICGNQIKEAELGPESRGVGGGGGKSKVSSLAANLQKQFDRQQVSGTYSFLIIGTSAPLIRSSTSSCSALVGRPISCECLAAESLSGRGLICPLMIRMEP